MKISVIVVGRNEGHKLKMCLSSLLNCREILSHTYQFEFTYVDSDSSDDSIQVALDHELDHVICISGEINSAVARNVGARTSSNEWLLFVDGDMEIHPSFFTHPITREYFTSEDFFSGQFIDVFYDEHWNELKREEFSPNEDVKMEPAPGGLFLVRKSIWNELNGMKDHYKRSQDFEFGLRCFQAGYIFKRIPALLATHHTISYLNFKRNITFFKGNNYLYSRSLLYRDHILTNFNRNGFKILIRQDYTLLVLIACLIAWPFVGVKVLLIYLAAILFRAIKNYKQGFFFYFIYIFVRDVSVLYGLFFFHPKKNLTYNVKTIK